MLQTALTVHNAPENCPEIVLTSSADSTQRYQYIKRGYSSLKFVIVDVSGNCHDEYWEQEFGEVVWHS